MIQATSKTTSFTNDEYRNIKAWSKSDLDNINKSPDLIAWNKNAPSVGSDSVDLGTHLHCALLEPDVFKSDYVTMPEFDNRSNAGKAQKKAWLETMSSSNKIILDSDTAEMLESMRLSVAAHPTANKLLTATGESEVSIFSDLQGLNVKCRPDRIPDPEHFGHMLIDVKKTADIDKFLYSVRDFRYHVQDAFYSDIYEKLTGFAPRFIFVVVGEKKSIGRHPVRVFELPDFVVEQGRVEYLKDLDLVKEFEGFGSDFHIEELDVKNVFGFNNK